MDNEKLDELYGLIKKTGYIQSIYIYREMDYNSTKESNIILVLSTCPFYEGDTKIKLTFHKVQELKLDKIDSFYNVFLEILDVSDRQLEDIKYYVNDIESYMISFACFDIEYEVV